MKNVSILCLWGILSLGITLSFAQESIYLMTYGPEQGTIEGDDDFKHLIFFHVPETTSGQLYLRVFDADCGGELDSRFDDFDTETRFRLFGGVGAYSAPSAKTAFPNDADITAGTQIHSEVFGVNAFQDNKWHNLVQFSPTAGEKMGSNYVFKLVIEGIKGDDGNIFDVMLSTSASRNTPPEGLKIETYSPTIRLPSDGIFAEMRFFVPEGMEELTVHNFDLANAKVHVETAFRSNIVVTTSGQDEWKAGLVRFENRERNRFNAVRFEGGDEIPNDATFYLTDNQGRNIPIELPIYVRRPNQRPIPQEDTKMLADCRTVVFDGARSTDADGDALEFFWDFGDGQTSEGIRVAHRYEEVGSYEAELIVSDDSGQVANSALSRFLVVINAPPKAEAGEDQVGAPGQSFQFDGSASSSSDRQIVRYVWDFGDGSGRIEAVNPSHIFQKSGVYKVSLRVEDDSQSPCNFDTDQLEVWVNAPPVVEIGEDRISSPEQTLTLDGSLSSDSDGEIANYLWDFGDGSPQATGKIVNHAYAVAGKYQVMLTVTDNVNASNNTAFDRLTVVVNDRPVANAGNDQRVAIGESVKFDGTKSIDRDGKIIDYVWDFGDGTSAQGGSVSHSYAKDASYVVTLTVQDDSTSTSDKHTDTITVIVNLPPIAVAGVDQVVTSSEVQFDGRNSSDKDGTITRYLWDFGDGTQSAEPAPIHVYSNPGTYQVNLTVTDDSGTSTNQVVDTLKVIVNETPIADAGNDRITALGQSLNFDASGSIDPDGDIIAYTWDFGDGQSGTGQQISHVYQTAGIYTVRLTVHDNTGHPNAIDHDEVIVSVNTAPVAGVAKEVFGVPGEMLTFDGSASYDPDGKITSYHWRFSDATEKVETVGQTKRAFSTPGVHSVTLTVTDSSGASNSQATDKALIYINHPPNARPNAPEDIRQENNILTCQTTIFFDGSASTDADGDVLNYRWDFGDGTPQENGVIVVHTFPIAGIYPVILTVDDGKGLSNSQNSASLTVKINQPPIADAGADKIVCAGEVVLFDGGASRDPEGGLLKYYWDFGNGEVAEGLNPTHYYNTGGVYQVTLTVKDTTNLPCNTDTAQMVIRVVESPVAVAELVSTEGTLTVCAHAVVQFDGSKSRDADGVVNSFSWDFGDGSTGVGVSPTHIYSQSGKFRVLLTITGERISDCDNTNTAELIVTVISAPVAKFSADEVVAVQAPVTFDATESSSESGDIISAAWDFGDGTSAEGVKATHTYNTPGKYTVKLSIKTDLETGCNAASVEDIITVNRAPVADAGREQFVGINQNVVFNGSSSKDPDGSIVSYVWDFGDGTEPKRGVEVRHRYEKSGQFTVTLKVTDNTEVTNNAATDTILVTVNATPVPAIDVVDWGCVGEAIQFSGQKSIAPDGEIVGYRWDFGDSQTAKGGLVSHTYNAPGRYEVTLTVDDGKAATNSKRTITKVLRINHPPTANAGPDRIICPGDTVTFDAAGSTERDGEIVSYHWAFGDGLNGTGKQVTHQYEKPGRYEVRLKVTDNSGTSCGVAEDIAVIIVNTPPIAVAGPDRVTFFGGAHDTVLFDGTKSYDPDGAPLTYLWDFGDGTSESGAKASHTYAKAGKYTVRLRVRDGSGSPCGEAWDELMVEVKKR